MRRLKRATAGLPLAVVVLGILVPVLLDRAEDARAPASVTSSAPRIAGRTAHEWAEQAEGQLERGSLRKALVSMKRAESVEPGAQFAAELAEIRHALRRSAEALELERRFLRGPVARLELRADGVATAGARAVIALPGESLWTLAGLYAAAERGVPADDVADADRYDVWDRLTDLNGVRELDVGERVLVPVPQEELAAMTDANGRDLRLVASAWAALVEGDLDEASRLRGELATAFAETVVSCRSLDDSLSASMARRDAELALEREGTLMEEARASITEAQKMPRITRHRERLAALVSARDDIVSAEDARDGAQCADALRLVERLLREEQMFVVSEDGSLVVAKSAGVAYTEAVRSAVEWLLQRELLWSGRSYPYSYDKTDDERAWARYLIAARALEGDADLTRTLESVGEEMLTLPDPSAFFSY
jgi:hypothetical protein